MPRVRIRPVPPWLRLAARGTVPATMSQARCSPGVGWATVCVNSAPAKPLNDAQMRGGLLCPRLGNGGSTVAAKVWLDIDSQVMLLQQRGLLDADAAPCRRALRDVGYYHLSGYGRFFQVQPSSGQNDYRPGSSFGDIATLQRLDSEVRVLCLAALSTVEHALRAGFANRFAEFVGSYGKLADPGSFHPSGATSRGVDELVLADLDRSKQPFVTRHRGDAGDYSTLPVWVAVEALSFGTLSKAIEYGKCTSVHEGLAGDLNVGRQSFSSQVRSFVALRNACAHLSRLWNDVSKNPPAVPNNLVGRAKRRVGQFDPHSYYHVFVALESFVSGIRPEGRFLASVDALMEDNDDYRAGLLNPRPY